MPNHAIKLLPVCFVSTFATPALAENLACDANDRLTIVSATDDGLFEETHGPENTIDGDFDPNSRWSNESQGSPNH